MKKINLGLVLGIILLSSLTIAGLSASFKDMEVNREDYTRLELVNSLKISHTDLKCDSVSCYSKIQTGGGRTDGRLEPIKKTCLEWVVTLNNTECSNEKNICVDVPDSRECINWQETDFTEQERKDQLIIEKEKLQGRILKRVQILESIQNKTVVMDGGTTTVVKKK